MYSLWDNFSHCLSSRVKNSLFASGSSFAPTCWGQFQNTTNHKKLTLTWTLIRSLSWNFNNPWWSKVHQWVIHKNFIRNQRLLPLTSFRLKTKLSWPQNYGRTYLMKDIPHPPTIPIYSQLECFYSPYSLVEECLLRSLHSMMASTNFWTKMKRSIVSL